jgi:hypothetical protein
MTLKMNYDGLYKIISGGQTGADAGGLIAGWRMGILTGGTAPDNFKTQLGPNPLLETFGLRPGGDYNQRTKTNILDSDGTVVIGVDLTSPGSRLTINTAKKLGKPVLTLDIRNLMEVLPAGNEFDSLAIVRQHGVRLFEFIVENQIGILNVAGNREILEKNNPHNFAGSSPITAMTDYIVCFALDLLQIDDLLIYKNECDESRV